MTNYLDVSGKTEDEAIAVGLSQLGLNRDDVSVEILERAKSGFLGIGSSPAKVRLTYEVPEAPAPAPESAPAPAKKPEQAPRKRERQGKKPVQEAPAKPQAKAEPKPRPEPKAKAELKAADAPAEGGQKERVERYLHGLLELMGVEAELIFTERPGGGLNVELSGSGMGAVIGRRGETLDAIQHLVNYSVNRGSDRRMHINVDAENYRSKREESLVHLAEKMAAKAIKYKRSMALEPMNSYERHVIHTALQNYEGVSTSSIGTEPNRRVVVSYDRAAANATGNKPQSREWA
ncbi:MAG: protein jag [Oscillospiraceae bacterium]|nr:protein jag [Oscillospiraceae bacterium]